MAVAGPMLQRDSPLPARLPRQRLCVWSKSIAASAGHGQRAVARQPVRPIHIGAAERTTDQQAAKARAVDEELPRHPAFAIEVQGGDVPVFAMAFDFKDFPFDPLDAFRFRITAQQARVEPGVEMVSVEQVGHSLALTCPKRHPPGAGGHLVKRITAERFGKALGVQAPPQRREGAQSQTAPNASKSVHVAMPRLSPSIEFDAELIACLGGRQEPRLLEAQNSVEQGNLGDRRLSDSDRPDVVGFDQADSESALEKAGEHGGGHPARGSAAGDNDFRDTQLRHST